MCEPTGVVDYPIAVLVHGSGALDKDETIYANKPFAELAHELANLGIATLRYDKRTYAYPNLSGFTIRDETIDDALSAVKLASELCNGPVYVIGHSLGATLAPWIATLTPKLSGIIMMAAVARPMDELIVEQTDYLLPSNASQEYKDEQIAAIKSRSPQYFEGEMANYDQVKTAQSLTLPILVLQGERDYQVRMTDYSIWQKALNEHANVEFHSYTGLNHLFHQSNSPGILSSPIEYQEEGAMPSQVIRDIAHFIKSTSINSKH